MPGNVQILRDTYAAFAAGDVPAVLSVMSPDIVWNEAENFPYADGNHTSVGMPWYKACSHAWAKSGISGHLKSSSCLTRETMSSP